ncbi:hypothetical protein QCA50_005536 [Cerrena zonata]|uniref:N-acetyltransferase domain-containing protein n=1 Tax=Cerrena zonata TaxID=2478898 RepID=A0AAW0GJM5_9APHY
MSLYKVDITSKDTIDAIAGILRPHIPQSLPVLGCLFSGDIEDSALTIWTTFSPITTTTDSLNHTLPPIYSVICHSSLNDHRFRFFCSAETIPTGDPKTEDTHVFRTIGCLLSDKEHGAPPEAWANGATPKPAGVIEFGYFPDRWITCLSSYITYDYPYLVFACPPRENPPRTPWNTSFDHEWEVSELDESDVNFVQERLVHFPRSRESVKARIHYSVCIRRKDGDNRAPVAWSGILSDGSTGMLYVEPDMRRKGLGRMCNIALRRKMEEMFATEDLEEKSIYPRARWEYNAIHDDNEASVRLTKSLEGWEGIGRRHCIWIRNWTITQHVS